MLRKNKFRFPKGVSGSVSKLENDHFAMSDGIFFFFKLKKKTRQGYLVIYVKKSM